MADQINRPAIYLTLAAIVGVIVFFTVVEAPRIQQDILSRCQDTLAAHRISTRGLSVDGRDVIVSGPPGSLITSPETYAVLEKVSGVRVVRTQILRSELADSDAPAKQEVSEFDGLGPTGPAQQRALQEKLDAVLENHKIGFLGDSDELTLDGKATLDKIAAYLQTAPALVCEIRGYAARTQEEDRQSWVLALQRALATEDYLESKGIANWRLGAHAKHIGDGTSDRRTDRKIDFVVLTR